MIYLTVIGQPPAGSSTVHIYTKTIQRTTQNKQYIEQHKYQEECGPCPVFAGFTLAFALQLRKKHGKTSVKVAIHKHIIRIRYIFVLIEQYCYDLYCQGYARLVYWLGFLGITIFIVSFCFVPVICHLRKFYHLSGGSLFHLDIQINQPTRFINLSHLLLVVQIQFNMFRVSSCPSSRAYKLQQPPLVYCRNVVVAVLLAVVGPTRPRPTTPPPPRSYGKPEAAAAVDRLLMMGIRMPETC